MKMWRKSSRSGTNGGQCVEACTDKGTFHARDSKAPETGYLTVSREDWAGLLAGIRNPK